MSKHLTLVKDSHSLILKQKNYFESLDKERALDFAREAEFALQILQKNSYTTEIASNNPDSLKNAIANVAICGLSLSPVHKLGYLVPRKNEVVFEPSYFGVMKLFTDSGAVELFHAEVICENDFFKLNGIGKEPTHNVDHFGDRGKKKGFFATAKLPNGNWITKVMSLDEIYKFRDRSDGYKSGKPSPWKSDEDEMCKKTVIRVLCDYIPKSKNAQKAHYAASLNEEYSQNNTNSDNSETEKPSEENSKKLKDIRDCLEKIKKLETDFIPYASGVFKREIKNLEDLTDLEIEKSLEYLTGKVKQQEVKNKEAEKSSTKEPENKESKKVKNHADKVVAGDLIAGDFFAENKGKRIRDINATELTNFVQRYAFQIELNPDNVDANVKEFVSKAKEFLDIK